MDSCRFNFIEISHHIANPISIRSPLKHVAADTSLFLKMSECTLCSCLAIDHVMIVNYLAFSWKVRYPGISYLPVFVRSLGAYLAFVTAIVSFRMSVRRLVLHCLYPHV